MKKMAYTSIALLLLAGCKTTQDQLVNKSEHNQSTQQQALQSVNQTSQTLTAQERKAAKSDTRGHRSRPMTEQRLVRILEEYNADKDKQVTWSEYNDWRLARFNKTDANQNGTVDAEEYVYEYENRLDSRYEQGRKAHIKQTHRRFDSLDKNGNKTIEWNEYEASGNRIFTRWDTNQDGTINEADPQQKAKYSNSWDSKKSDYLHQNAYNTFNERTIEYL